MSLPRYYQELVISLLPDRERVMQLIADFVREEPREVQTTYVIVALPRDIQQRALALEQISRRNIPFVGYTCDAGEAGDGSVQMLYSDGRGQVRSWACDSYGMPIIPIPLWEHRWGSDVPHCLLYLAQEGAGMCSFLRRFSQVQECIRLGQPVPVERELPDNPEE